MQSNICRILKKLINIQKDPIGKALVDYLNGERDHKIKVNSTVALEEDLDPSYFFREYNQMPGIEQLALQYCKGEILDVGSGAGSHALYLQHNNFRVDAIDVSPNSVQAMKSRGINNASLNNFYDVKNTKYDTILFLMNGFGMSAKLKNVPSFLNHCLNLLTEDGQILFDSSDIKYLYEQDDGSFIINLNAEYYGEVIYQINYREIKGEPFEWLFLDIDNLMSICEAQKLNLEILTEDSHHQYLARIKKS